MRYFANRRKAAATKKITIWDYLRWMEDLELAAVRHSMEELRRHISWRMDQEILIYGPRDILKGRVDLPNAAAELWFQEVLGDGVEAFLLRDPHTESSIILTPDDPNSSSSQHGIAHELQHIACADPLTSEHLTEKVPAGSSHCWTPSNPPLFPVPRLHDDVLIEARAAHLEDLAIIAARYGPELYETDDWFVLR